MQPEILQQRAANSSGRRRVRAPQLWKDLQEKIRQATVSSSFKSYYWCHVSQTLVVSDLRSGLHTKIRTVCQEIFTRDVSRPRRRTHHITDGIWIWIQGLFEAFMWVWTGRVRHPESLRKYYVDIFEQIQEYFEHFYPDICDGFSCRYCI